MFFGRLLRLVQSFKFIKRRLLRSPMDGCNSYKLGQSFIIIFSRFGNFEKSGDLFKYLEWLRLRIFRFNRTCKKINVREKWKTKWWQQL
jgi:hypothetical protein